ncbi:DUF397 domain-containing protein [Streptomyces longispororuber]|uniref:DUF397 domain-containing protein n=1 Tax=Streptomyces longispororuber TaxID=68230 RepID=UPI0036FBFF2A
MNTPDLANAAWRTSSYSSGQGACVEVAPISDGIATRDTKDRTGPVLAFTREGWDSFIRGLATDEFRP